MPDKPSGVFLLPGKQEDIVRVQACCEQAGLAPPVQWDWAARNQTIELLLAAQPAERYDFSPLPSPVIVLHSIPKESIQAFARALKASGPWPLLALVTPQSREMSLDTLLTHLQDDQQKEAEIRARREKNAAESSFFREGG